MEKMDSKIKSSEIVERDERDNAARKIGFKSFEAVKQYMVEMENEERSEKIGQELLDKIDDDFKTIEQNKAKGEYHWKTTGIKNINMIYDLSAASWDTTDESITKLRPEVIEKLYDYSKVIARAYGNENAYLTTILHQEKVPVEIMNEIIDEGRGSNYTWHAMVTNKSFSPEMANRMASGSHLQKDAIANLLSMDKKKASFLTSETLYALATDPDIDEEIRMKLMKYPEFLKTTPELPEPEKFSFSVRHITYGGHGPGDFDNRGGEAQLRVSFETNGESTSAKVLAEYVSSSFMGGSEPDARKWAHNWGTDFDGALTEEEASFIVGGHEQALAFIASNGEVYESRKNLMSRIRALEKNHKQQQPNSTKDLNENDGIEGTNENAEFGTGE